MLFSAFDTLIILTVSFPSFKKLAFTHLSRWFVIHLLILHVFTWCLGFIMDEQTLVR